MAVAVLSPCVLEIRGESEEHHYYQLATLIDNIQKFTNLKFQLYKNAPYDGYKMKVPDYNQNPILNNLVMVNIYGAIQKMLTGEYIDLDGFAEAKLPDSFRLGVDPLSQSFCSYLSYLRGENSILFIGEDNFSVSRPIEMISDVNFTMDASTYIFLELTNVLLPYLKDDVDYSKIFPRESFCSKYNGFVIDSIKQKGLDQAGKNALFEMVGEIVARYNYYEKNNHLSRLNTTKSKKRIVYEKTVGKKYYLSLDLESGGFEVFDQRFRHLGQFDFSCIQVKQAEPRNHGLKH